MIGWSCHLSWIFTNPYFFSKSIMNYLARHFKFSNALRSWLRRIARANYCCGLRKGSNCTKSARRLINTERALRSLQLVSISRSICYQNRWGAITKITWPLQSAAHYPHIDKSFTDKYCRLQNWVWSLFLIGAWKQTLLWRVILSGRVCKRFRSR